MGEAVCQYNSELREGYANAWRQMLGRECEGEKEKGREKTKRKGRWRGKEKQAERKAR